MFKLNASCWYQIFALDSVSVKTQNSVSSRGGFITYAVFYNRERIKSIHYEETKKGLMTGPCSDVCSKPDCRSRDSTLTWSHSFMRLIMK